MDLALNNLQWLIYHEPKLNQTSWKFLWQCGEVTVSGVYRKLGILFKEMSSWCNG